MFLFCFPSLVLEVPPDKPENIMCETTRSSDNIICSWEKGQKTHVITIYNISLNRYGVIFLSQIHLYQVFLEVSLCFWQQLIFNWYLNCWFCICRGNGTRVELYQIQDDEQRVSANPLTTISRAVIEENIKYKLIITAYNHFGESQSDPFIFCLKDIGKTSFLQCWGVYLKKKSQLQYSYM